MPSKQMSSWIESVRGTGPATPDDLDTLRQSVDRRYAASPVPADLRVQQAEYPVRGEWLEVRGQPSDGTVLYLHGGGYILGRPAHFRQLVGAYARKSGYRFFVADYRLAPEHRFPAAVDDAVNAYRWLLDDGLDPDVIVIGGDSAGGGLAIAALLAIAGSGLPRPARCFVLSPWVDLTLTSDSMTAAPSADPWVWREDLEYRARHYLGDADARHPLASPLYADLSDLPPIHIEVGSADRLVDDSRQLAATTRAASVDNRLHVTDGGIHCFPLHVPDAPESTAAIARIASFICNAHAR